MTLLFSPSCWYLVSSKCDTSRSMAERCGMKRSPRLLLLCLVAERDEDAGVRCLDEEGA